MIVANFWIYRPPMKVLDILIISSVNDIEKLMIMMGPTIDRINTLIRRKPVAFSTSMSMQFAISSQASFFFFFVILLKYHLLLESHKTLCFWYSWLGKITSSPFRLIFISITINMLNIDKCVCRYKPMAEILVGLRLIARVVIRHTQRST